MKISKRYHIRRKGSGQGKVRLNPNRELTKIWRGDKFSGKNYTLINWNTKTNKFLVLHRPTKQLYLAKELKGDKLIIVKKLGSISPYTWNRDGEV